jgi:hypothetical protein
MRGSVECQSRVPQSPFLSNSHLEEKLERCRQLLGMASAHPTTPAPETPKGYRDRYEPREDTQGADVKFRLGQCQRLKLRNNISGSDKQCSEEYAVIG